jgi:hypothetical protein
VPAEASPELVRWALVVPAQARPELVRWALVMPARDGSGIFTPETSLWALDSRTICIFIITISSDFLFWVPYYFMS